MGKFFFKIAHSLRRLLSVKPNVEKYIQRPTERRRLVWKVEEVSISQPNPN